MLALALLLAGGVMLPADATRLWIAAPSVAFAAESANPSRVEEAQDAPVDCARLAELLQQQKNLISRETGQLKREIALLRQDISRPGIQEIFSGIGYIFGLAGVGLYVHSRRRSQDRD